jgi:hypothetical protein
MILVAISRLIATRDSMTLTMILPLFSATTVTWVPGTKPSLERNFRVSSLPPTFFIEFSTPIRANDKGMVLAVLSFLVSNKSGIGVSAEEQ